MVSLKFYQNSVLICLFGKPKWFVMENVARIEKSQIITSMTDIFKQNNYGLTSSIINAS
jgi:DNA (cytosine-5)-methyltransferase 1